MKGKAREAARDGGEVRRLGEERDERNKGEKNGRVGGGEWSRIIIVL